VIKLGAMGLNMEDFDRRTTALFSIEEARDKIRRVMKTAEKDGVPDFVVNARTDALFSGLS
jgi:2-methylisocitrate lyase-like PEP mutase family enzyme